MNQISDRQIELLTKIFDRSATRQQIEEYICLIVSDNIIGMEKLPTIAFIPAKKMQDTYAMMNRDDDILTISTMAIDDLKRNPDYLYFVINTLGHECKHFMQGNVSESDLLPESIAYHQKVKEEMKQYDEASGEYKNSLMALQNFNNQQILIDYLTKHNNQAFAQWYLSLVQDDRDHLFDYTEESRYLSGIHEVDARYASILYSAMILERYLTDERIQKNAKLHAFLSKMKQKCIEVATQDYKLDLDDCEFYHQFDQALQNTSLSFLQSLSTDLADIQTENSNKKQTLQAMLYLASKGYIKSTFTKDLPKVFTWAVQNINSQTSNKMATPERILACSLANSIYFDERLNLEQRQNFKKELFETYKKHADCPKNQINAESHVHKFDSSDTFMLHIAAISNDQIMYDIMRSLDENKRYQEVCNFVDFKQLYDAETDQDGFIPLDYLNNIGGLLVGKCEMLVAINDEFINAKFTHSGDAKRLNWYISELKKTKSELQYFYCKQSEKPSPKTDKEYESFKKFIKVELEFDVSLIDQMQEQAEKIKNSHPARFDELEK